MYRDEFAYFLNVSDIRPDQADKLITLMQSEDFFDGRLTPDHSQEDLLANRIQFDCGMQGSITGIDREEVDKTMHALAQAFPEATFFLHAENVDNPLEKYEIKTHGDLYSCAEQQYHMPELSEPVPFDQRLETKKEICLDQFLHRTDFDALYQQKQDLVHALYSGANVPAESLEGLIHFLDFIGDWAEQEGVFVYPNLDQEETITDQIMALAESKLHETTRINFPLPDNRYSVSISVAGISDDYKTPGNDYYSVELIQNSPHGHFRKFSCGVNYNDFAGLREACDCAITHYEHLLQPRKPSLAEVISSAACRTTATTGKNPSPDREIT